MIMGLGTRSLRRGVYRDGQVANGELSDYPVPAFADLPGALTCELIEREGAEIHGLGRRRYRRCRRRSGTRSPRSAAR